ncbi:E3 ubiquitin-protein ligase RNF169-like [Hetaerina americana]|uniref:E3 ubiquitin-protein ligase RNF169-like n=1 Tax=Hetaerina americana TaxID=62018 RepID=UPI003A7F493B
MAKSLKSPGILRKNIRKPLSLVDVECPVCRDVFIEPVTLPCKHRLCLQCFDGTMENVSLQCPMCRTRVGGWLRAATKDNRVIDVKLWELIKCEFSEYVEAKLRGEAKEIRAELRPICVSQPGEVRREYEMHKKSLEEEQRRQREEEEKASTDLIRKLQEEESEELTKKTMKIMKALELDEEVARKMMLDERNRFKVTSPSGSVKKTVQISLENKAGSNQPNRTENKENKALKSSTSAMKGPMDIFLGKKKTSSYTMKPLAIGSTDNVKGFLKHELIADGEKGRSLSSLSAGSCDSINQEMHHFKPIKVAPRTPPKQMPDGRVIEPKLVKITPMHLSPCVDDKSGRISLHKYLTSGEVNLTSKIDPSQISMKSNVVRELFPPVISPNEPRGPSAFCGTGALETDKDGESNNDTAGPGEPKIPKMGFGHSSVEASLCEEVEEGGSKHPMRKRKRKRQPCDPETGRQQISGPLLTNMQHSHVQQFGEGNCSRCDPSDDVVTISDDESSLTETFLEQQYQIEAKLRQEKEDMELAQRLQREWNGEDKRVDRRKGSHLGYDLRRKLPVDGKDKKKGGSRSRSSASKVNKSPVRGLRQRLLGEVMPHQSKVAK